MYETIAYRGRNTSAKNNKNKPANKSSASNGVKYHSVSFNISISVELKSGKNITENRVISSMEFILDEINIKTSNAIGVLLAKGQKHVALWHQIDANLACHKEFCAMRTRLRVDGSVYF